MGNNLILNTSTAIQETKRRTLKELADEIGRLAKVNQSKVRPTDVKRVVGFRKGYFRALEQVYEKIEELRDDN